MKKIVNLLPKEEVSEFRLEQMAGQIFSFWIWTLATLAAVFVLSLGSSVLLTQRISANQNDIENKRQQLRSSATKQLELEVSTLNRQIALIENLRKDHYYWSNAFLELLDLLDTDARVNLVEMDRATGKVDVSGTSGDRDSVLSFWAAVKKSNMFKDINFPLTNLERDVDANFNYTFYVKPEEMNKE
ncbi:MAG: hypothetical protein KW793_01335 [Candidatus Doudnabacteria bacterium]|nr:hypothetical protein [Candidatus Doudnabacteria bacterium]